jgi:cytidine deaminase
MNWDRAKEKMLADAAAEARKRAYAPYSGFSVGAALLTEQGKIYTGCNVENAAFTPGCCAERTAFFKAVSEGEHEFAGIAVVGGKTGEKPLPLCPPCGVCRQVMQEFCDPQTFRIILPSGSEEWKVYTLAELLPLGFGGHGKI